MQAGATCRVDKRLAREYMAKPLSDMQIELSDAVFTIVSIPEPNI
jgi:hypothetical protein